MVWVKHIREVDAVSVSEIVCVLIRARCRMQVCNCCVVNHFLCADSGTVAKSRAQKLGMQENDWAPLPCLSVPCVVYVCVCVCMLATISDEL